MSLTGVTSSSRTLLCEHILHLHFGAAVGAVSSVLLNRGRLSYETLLRLVPRTLTQRSVQASLLVLVQHNCLFHVQDSDDGLEYFEMNVPEILQRRKIGSVAAMARDMYGKRGADAILRVLVNGKFRLSDLVADMSGESHASSSASPEYCEVVKTVYEILEARTFRPITRVDHTSKDDQDLQYEKQLLRQIKGPPGPKDIKRIKNEVMENRIRLDREHRDWGQDVDRYVELCEHLQLASTATAAASDSPSITESHSRKRKSMASSSRHTKATRLDLPFDSAIFVRVDFTSFDLKMRNELVCKAVKAHRGPAAAHIVQNILSHKVARLDDGALSSTLYDPESTPAPFDVLLSAAEKRSPSRRAVPLPEDDSYDRPLVNGNSEAPLAITMLFPKVNTVATMGLEAGGEWLVTDKEPDELVSEILHHLANTCDSRQRRDDLISPADIAQAQLDRSTTRNHTWVISSEKETYPTATKRSNWSVDFIYAHEQLKLSLLESHIKKSFSRHGYRIWRAVDEKGKMEEKQIAKLTMLPAKDVRAAIGHLSAAGFLHQQEIPRSTDRNPSRTIFLWYVSRSLSYRTMITRLYDALVNIAIRYEEETCRHRALLRRAERSDVRENIQLLERTDRDELETLDWRLESLGVAQERIDRDLFVLETLPIPQRPST